MRKRNNIIIALSVAVVAMFCTVVFLLIPQQREQERSYLLAQREPATHDLSRILPYKSKYMGNASNNCNLFQNLPLSEELNGFQQNTKELKLTVNYKDDAKSIELQRLRRILVYNSISAFSLVDNLQMLEYHFRDESFFVKRSDVERAVSDPLSELLISSKWKTKVQEPLKNADATQKICQAIVKRCP